MSKKKQRNKMSKKRQRKVNVSGKPKHSFDVNRSNVATKIRGLLLLFAVSKCTKTDPFGIVKENYYPTSFNRRISPIQEFNQILVGSGILVLWVRKSSSFLEKKWKCISRVITMFF
jgi:hypothetical protein